MDWNTFGIMFWNNLLLMGVIVIGILAIAFVAASIWVMIEERRKSPEAEEQERRLREVYESDESDEVPLADQSSEETMTSDNLDVTAVQDFIKRDYVEPVRVEEPKKRRGGRPKGSKNKAKVAVR